MCVRHGPFAPGADDHTLADGSPAVDVGDPTDAPSTDLAGNGRPQGGGIDLGALEQCEGELRAARRLRTPSAPATRSAAAPARRRRARRGCWR